MIIIRDYQLQNQIIGNIIEKFKKKFFNNNKKYLRNKNDKNYKKFKKVKIKIQIKIELELQVQHPNNS